MKIRDYSYLSITVVVNVIACYAAYVAAPPEATMGDLYRIFYIHTPAAWVCYLTLAISLLASILFLAKRETGYDTLAEVSVILGVIYGVVALVTGSIWANAVWGEYWNWDPRETTTLILWMAYMGYISLRLSIGNPEKRASTSAVYNVFAFSTVPLSFLSIKLWQSLHPELVVPGSGISITAPMVETLLLNLISSSLVFVYLLRMMYSARSLQKRMDILAYEKGR
ncbi:MAG: cytochrome C assembly protein [Candidatus Korarchaeota archaeon]|nr:cytochrome C assembly protein [Candidatus Korarchaeota archaeon]